MSKVTSIKFTSRASVKIGTSFYTVEACIERSVSPDATDEEVAEAKKQLWEECNTEVDNQVTEIVNLSNKA